MTKRDPQAGSRPDAGNWEREIRTLEAEACRVLVARDFDALAAMFSERLMVNNPLNQVVGKAQVLAGLEPGDRVIVGNVGTLGRGMQVQIIGSEQGGRGASRSWRW